MGSFGRRLRRTARSVGDLFRNGETYWRANLFWIRWVNAVLLLAVMGATVLGRRANAAGVGASIRCSLSMRRMTMARSGWRGPPADPIRAMPATRSGRRAAQSVAMSPPIELPTSAARSSSTTSSARSA